jgi:hypothetical protein
MKNSTDPFFKLDPNDETRCDLCGRCKENVRPRTQITVGLQSGTVRTKFCDQCATAVEKGIDLAVTEQTDVILLDRPLTAAEGEQVTRQLVEDAVERDLPKLLEKYRAIEKQSGRRIQACITDYDETTYNFLHIGTEWTHGFWRMVNEATAHRLRHEGFSVRFVGLDLNDYMEWLARENLQDSSAARERFAAAVADWEMGLSPTAPARRLETETRK